MLPVKPFNGVFWMILALTIVSVAAIRRNFAGQPYARKTHFLTCLCACNIVVFFVYKFMLSIDAEFPMLAGIDRFNWFNELPLQLCNINLFLIPLGVLTRKRPVLGFAFFIAPLGALMAMCFPEPPFVGYSLFLPRMLGFYGTHGLLVVCGLSLAVMGFYRPHWRDFPGIIGAYGVLTVAAHGINLLLRATGLCAQANYFFTFGAEISVLQWFWSMIPRPLFYELPAPFILLAYMSAVTGGFSLGNRLRLRRLAARMEEELAGSEEEQLPA